MTSFDVSGLSTSAVVASRTKNGTNAFDYHETNGFLISLKNLATEPMILILLAAASVYFITGHVGDGLFLSAAVVLEVMLSLFQDARSRNALSKLQDLTQPRCKVIRNNSTIEIHTNDIVLGDFLLLEEGDAISADGTVVQASDFTVNESILTGESAAVLKDESIDDKSVYQGTTVASGQAVAVVTAIGNETKLGKIGKSLEAIEEEKTPLEVQILRFVKKMAIAGAVVFVFVMGINFYRSGDVLFSLLKALTLAMSLLPEEIPVAFTMFMALGAFRLMKMGIVVKQMKTVETLGSATVICIDKTGTITENKMSLARNYVLDGNAISETDEITSEAQKELFRIAMFASEPVPFDGMETALHQAYQSCAVHDQRADFRMIHEYPLGGQPPMMTHIFQSNSGQRIVAAKGAPEAIMAECDISDNDRTNINRAISTLSNDGYRVLAVAQAEFNADDFPQTQQELYFHFKGLVTFYDPPKKNIHNVLNDFYNAGISVKIITGDNDQTTTAIARQIGFRNYEKHISGEDLMQLSDTDLANCVAETSLFTRMFPEAKL